MSSPKYGWGRLRGGVGRLTAAGVVGLAIAGCGSANDVPAEVWGKVVYRGKPVRGGVIVFAPSDGRESDWAIGIIKPDGDFYVIPTTDRRPLSLGRYDVSFRRPSSIGPSVEGLEIPEKYLDSDHPYFTMELRRLPAEVLITLRD